MDLTPHSDPGHDAEGRALSRLTLAYQFRTARFMAERAQRDGRQRIAIAYGRMADACMDAFLAEAGYEAGR